MYKKLNFKAFLEEKFANFLSKKRRCSMMGFIPGYDDH